MALPLHWCDRLFERLTLAYGIAFIRQWDGIDIAQVKAYWADELGGLSADAIGFGLSVLPPDKPPNAIQFRLACQRAPERPMARLPPPKATEADRERVRQMLKGIRDKLTRSAH